MWNLLCTSSLFRATVLLGLLSGLAFSPAPAYGQDAFITTWETTSANESITIPTENSSVDYDFTIDWGDGTTEQVNGSDPDPSHTYDAAGTYTVAITGSFPRIFLNAGSTGDGDETNARKLQSIDQWGSIQWESLQAAFAGASNMTYSATDTPDLSNVTSVRSMFDRASSFNGDIGDWDVSNITDMSAVFFDASSFNQSIGQWDVSSAENMEFMFAGASSFNQPVGQWDVSNVTSMANMFQRATAFDQDISGWNVSNVTNMNFMFDTVSGESDFNQPIGQWDVSSATSMRYMFNGASSFNQDLSVWDVSNVVDFDSFLGGSGLSTANYDALLIGWSRLDLLSGASLGASNLQYCDARPFRAYLQDEFGWTISDDGQADGCPEDLSASGTQTVNSDGLVSFTSGIRVDFSGTSGSGRVTASRFGEAPNGVDGISESNVSSYRLVIVAGPDLSFGDQTKVRFDTGEFGGIDQPSDITVYSRPAPGTGMFSQLTTSYDSGNDEIVAETSSFSELVFASDTNELPVELASFEGTATDGGVRLTWQTASEQNNAGFEVQRKAGPSGWNRVGYVESKADGGITTEAKSYQFVVGDLPVGTHQFRLRQVDLDGSPQVHGPIEVDVQMQEALRLTVPAPSPVSSTATLSFAVKEEAEASVAVYDMLGRKVQTLFDGRPTPGESTRLRLDASGLPSGPYIIRLRADGQTRTQRMMVVR